MKLLSLLSIIVLVIAFSSCSDDENNSQTVIDAGIEISVQSSADGVDLLSPQTPGFYKKDEIKFYELIGEEKVLVNNPNEDFPSGFMIFVDADQLHRIRFFGNAGSPNLKVTNIIDWNATEIDTLEYIIERGDNYTIINKVWFNGEEKWDAASQTERFFIIEK